MPIPVPMPIIPVDGSDVENPVLVVILAVAISVVATSIIYFILERRR